MEKNKTHAVKCWPEFFREVLLGNKPFELRKDDRNYQVGDHILLQEYDPITKKYTGPQLEFEITFKVKNTTWLQPGICALGLGDI